MHFLMPDLMFILPTFILSRISVITLFVRLRPIKLIPLKLPDTVSTIGMILNTIRRQMPYVSDLRIAYFVKFRTADKNKLTTLIELSFPGIEDLFSYPERDIDGHKKAIDFIIR